MRTALLFFAFASTSLAQETFDRTVRPAPLERGEFRMPEFQSGQLSNGVDVLVATDRERPLVNVSIHFDVGSYADPVGQEGLASATVDMLNEGAGDYDALSLSTAFRRLATTFASGSDQDTAKLSINTLTANLEPSLALLATVLLEPTFPDEDWDRLRKQRIQSLQEARAEPRKMAARAGSRLLYGDDYRGRLSSEASYLNMEVEDMALWKQGHLVPNRAVILVSGDTDLDTILPMLEAHFAEEPSWLCRVICREEPAWSGHSDIPLPTPEGIQPDETRVYLVDKPGAAQSVIRMNRFVRHRLDEDYTALMLGNHVFGGMFMARLNMNLREDKGYTYGARSYLSHGHGPSRWILSTSVKSDVTRPALEEILLEIGGLAQEELGEQPEPRPITEDDVAYFSSNLVNGYPSRFEDASYVLTSQAGIRLYGLPAEWLSGFMDRVEAVDAISAQEAFVADVASQPWNIIIVGDLATIRESIEGLGYPVVELDADGNLVSAEESRED